MHSLAVPSTAPVDGAEAGRAPLHVGRPPTPRPATKTSGPHPLPSRLCHLIKPRIQSRHSQSTAIASTTTKTAHHSKMQQDPSPSREIYYNIRYLSTQVPGTHRTPTHPDATYAYRPRQIYNFTSRPRPTQLQTGFKRLCSKFYYYSKAYLSNIPYFIAQFLIDYPR